MPVLDQENVRRACFGDIAEHVENERVVEAALLGLQDGAAIVGIEAAGLGVGRHRFPSVGRRNGETDTEKPAGEIIGDS